jgi:hypothetical protein
MDRDPGTPTVQFGRLQFTDRAGRVVVQNSRAIEAVFDGLLKK